MKNRVIAGSLLVATLLSGCAGTGRSGDKSYSDDPAYQKLQETAKNIQQSLTQLAEAEQYDKMKNRPSQPRIYTQIRGMEQVVTMPWHGSLEQAVSKLASFSGYEVKFMGKPPAVPIFVQIGESPASVSDHLRNVGIQAGVRADIVVNPSLRVVEVRYTDGAV
ncbi:DotD/TraH family lipoprotein [Pseudomonas aeruginosa]|uniref:DotD/TraH family lipoprotein n=1 Tax=Pseudomonas aeruginosa TaxID=287 RepID=UPI00053D5E51|nr:DotD/TraH family lipoprotein [Pseudomonas aeruginosa]